MQGYQADIQTFTDSGAVVFGVSTDPLDTNKKFAESLSLEFAILSDEGGAVSKEFGVLNERNMSNRTTFVIGKDGKIAHVESGGGAIDPAGAAAACSKL